MFDYIKITGLSITNVPSWVAKAFEEEIFQTKSLYCYLEEYEIREDGYLYRKEEDDDGIFWVKIKKTINLEFHNSYYKNWLSFEAIYKRGELIKINCLYHGTIKDRFKELNN